MVAVTLRIPCEHRLDFRGMRWRAKSNLYRQPFKSVQKPGLINLKKTGVHLFSTGLEQWVSPASANKRWSLLRLHASLPILLRLYPYLCKKRCQLEYRKSSIKTPREGWDLYISNRFERVLIETGGLFERGSFSSSLRPGTKGFTWGKWIISYNFGIDDGTESKFGTHKELTVLNILKY